MNRLRNIKALRRAVVVTLSAAALFVVWLGVMRLIVPEPLFSLPLSTTLYSRDGELLGARLSDDEQWRFAPVERVPEKFEKALLTYEDKRFRHHPGIDPLSMARAVKQNIEHGSVVSGGSTITMQLARAARGNRERTIWQKAVEAIWALYLECRYDKDEILALYASFAPFGGNTVGLAAASWRYFNRPPDKLSWAENATLAVLPNAPSLIHLERNRETLKRKRDALLKRMADEGIIDETELSLSLQEPLAALRMSSPPRSAEHLVERMRKERVEGNVTVTLDKRLQDNTRMIVENRVGGYRNNDRIFNAAVVVADVRSGEVLAYVGNTEDRGDDMGYAVDAVMAERSSGSILKPFLYAGMLDDGMLLPEILVEDVPLKIGNFSPQNYDKSNNGVIPASEALTRSLNVPLVRMLSQYKTGRFMELLEKGGMTTLRYSEEHYGLSLILGGAECTLWDICGMYASLARTLTRYTQTDGRYLKGDIHPLTLSSNPYTDTDPLSDSLTDTPPLLSAASIWFTFEAMSRLNRPEEEAGWQNFSSMKRVAWKTGTSFGSRDAWAVGVTPRHVVGVWVGNASGEGRPGVTGVTHAAPIMFDIFSLLPSGEWFAPPLDDMTTVEICPRSGHKASPSCPVIDSVAIPRRGIATEPCPYHITVHLTPDGLHRVNSSCESVERMVESSWFVLPPAQAYYYSLKNMDYLPLPPLKEGCRESGVRPIEIIYPEYDAVISLPRDFDGSIQHVVFKAAHSDRNAVIYWYIDDNYIGMTEGGDHSIAVRPESGRHLLTLTDQQGNNRKIFFTIKPTSEK